MLMMKFEKYADNKFMATNAIGEVDIVVGADGFGLTYTVETSTDSNTFESWDKAVRFAEHKHGVRFNLQTEDEYYDELFLQDSDGMAILGGQVSR